MMKALILWSPWFLRTLRRGGVAALVVALAGCATAPPPAAPGDAALPFAQAVSRTADALLRQTEAAGNWRDRLGRQTLVIDPTLDAVSGQQTEATRQMDLWLAERVGDSGGAFELRPFDAAQATQARYLLTGTLARQPEGDWRIALAMVDLPRGMAVAQAHGLAAGEGVDRRPLPYWRDSPVHLKDAALEGYVRTSATQPGQLADRAYLDRLATTAAVQEAIALYNAERYQEALGQYRSALAQPAGEQLRVLNGIYLSTVKLGQLDEAEAAFGRVVDFGIAANELGVKLLFNPGGTDFWPDPQVSGVYPMWLRQIARASARSQACLEIVGHTSRTGSAAFNDALSLRRASLVRRRLGEQAPEVARRARVEGMGFRQNLVGSGTDDGVDALDRRVEFRVAPCAAGAAGTA